MKTIKTPTKEEVRRYICEGGYLRGRKTRVKDMFCMANILLFLSKIDIRKRYKRYFRLRSRFFIKEGKIRIVKLNRTLKEFKLK